MRTVSRSTIPALAPALALLLSLVLAGCALLQPAPPEQAAPEVPTAPASPAAIAPAPPEAPAALDAATLTGRLNVLINDTDPDSADFLRQRAELAAQPLAADVPADLRRVLAQTLAFAPPRLRERWAEHQQSLDNAAAQYAEHLPLNTNAVAGARVVRRLGPALYLIRLPGDDTALFATGRRLKIGARLRGIPAVERQRPKPDPAKGDLVDELADEPRTFEEISKQDVRRLTAERAPVQARLRALEAESANMERSLRADLDRLDAFRRESDATLSPRLLNRAGGPAPAALIRKVRRMGRSYSAQQYYRYALPITGRPQVDAALKGYLDARRKDVQDLLHSTGIGRGRMRANVDRIAFTAFTASPRLLSVRFEELRDTGGAHPNLAFASFVFDLQTQARLALGDIFSDLPEAIAVLSDLAARRLEQTVDGAAFAEGYAPQEKNFAVFVLDGADLVVTFPPYQTASFAQGPQTLRVPLTHPRLLPLLAPGLLEALGGK